MKILHPKAEVPDEALAQHDIQIYRGNKRLSFESMQPVVRNVHILSPSGRRLWINKRLQLCYQSAYGVRFSLYGLSRLKDYLMFPPAGRENDLTIQEIRWMPSERYVLVRHYTHGLPRHVFVIFR